jgi:D-serine dehydratase
MNNVFKSREDPLLISKIKTLEEVMWINDHKMKFKEILSTLPISYEDVIDAEARLQRFAPYIRKEFPEVKDGIIESPVHEINKMKKRLECDYSRKIKGTLLLKRDDLLPIVGSVKARGGIYEVLKHAEKLAIENNMLSIDDDYSVLSEERYKKFFSNFTVQVGSTGNLGLSIGIISAKIGFKVVVHMSKDAKRWKKELLRSEDVKVVEYDGDFSVAIEEGRKRSKEDPNSYFVDDENSKDLFLGYAVGGIRIKQQLSKLNIIVDDDHPLYVYLPCGVGGSPGGITFGLKLIYGDNVRCFFAEPTHSPAMLLALITGLFDKVSVNDFGLDNKTEADGLAVGRASSLATRMMNNVVDGIFTVEDKRLYTFLKTSVDEENIYLEPSAFAGFLGPIYFSEIDNINHMCWATGGSLVPTYERKRDYEKALSLLKIK